MIKNSHKLLSLILALSVVLSLSACFGNKSDSNGENATSDAMGRYVEQEESLVEDVLSIVSMVQMTDGSLRMLGDSGGGGIGPWVVKSSSDGGLTWTNVEYPWLADLIGAPINAAALTPDGVYIAHMANVLEEADIADVEPVFEADDIESAESIVGEKSVADDSSEADSETETSNLSPGYTFVYGDANGLTEIPFNPVSELDNIMTTTLYSASNGDLFSIGLSDEILQIDTVNWKVKNTYQVAPVLGEIAGVATYGNTLAINSGDTINLYDLETGSATGEISTIGSSQASYMTQKAANISIPADGSAYYYGNETGIYRVPMDTAVSERLVDGGLSSLGIQTLNFTNVFSVGDDEYLALAETPEFSNRLFRYTYNPDMPTEPGQVVKVYSLYDNKTIRQAIASYQLQYPDVRVSYQVGLDGSGGITAADAMRTLSTELLAVKGPDVIVMDDMDVDGYIQKNVLKDISDIVASTETLSNITGAFNKDGALYGVPARFFIPMLLGDDIQNVKNLSDFTSWLDTQYTYDIGIRADELVERFYASCSYRWFKDDGSLDKDAFRSDLEQLGNLAEGIRGVGEIQSFDNVAIDTLLWYGGAISANYGIVGGYMDVSLFDVAIKNRPTGSYSPFPNDKGDVYIPGTILGINAATESTDNAENFVKHVLSEEIQATNLGDGFPVNNAAFERLSQNPNPDSAQDEMMAQLIVKDARTDEMREVSLSGAWPSDEFMSELKTMLRSTQVPVKANAVIREMIIDETAGYISGTKSLDDTVSSFGQKMELYLSE